MDSIKRFINKHKFSLTCEWADSNPNMANDEWAKQANHWKCLIKRGSKRLTVYYSMGCGLSGEPKLCEVLESLKMDFDCSIDSFESWCDNLGYNRDSIKALRAYKLSKRLSFKFARFMGELMDEFLRCVENGE